MPVLSLACHLSHNTPHIPSRYNNEQTTKQTKAINNSYIYINISCKCDTNRAGHFTLDAYASRPVACYQNWHDMMTSSNGNIFHVTGPLCGEFTGAGEFPTQRPVTRSLDVFFGLRLNKPLSKQSWGWWLGTPSHSLWRYCYVFLILLVPPKSTGTFRDCN